MTSSRGRCAACKSLRRKCPKDCVLGPYFPSSNPYKFSCVHKIFGASNITKMLQQLPIQLRSEAAECMSFEASSRVRDPVYGCVGIISQLQEQINRVQTELVKAEGEVAYYNAQNQQQQQILAPNQKDYIRGDNEDPFWIASSAQQDPLTYLNKQFCANSHEQLPPFG